MTRSTQPKLQEKYQHYVDSYTDHPGWRECAIRSYRQGLVNEIVEFITIGSSGHASIHIPLERLEKAWLILNGIGEE